MIHECASLANCAVITADMLAVIAAWGCTPCGSSFAGGGLSASRFSEALSNHPSLTSEQIAEGWIEFALACAASSSY